MGNQAVRSLVGLLSGKRWLEITLLIIIVSLTVSVFFEAILLPLTGNDPLLYTTMSKLIYKYKTISIYPFVNPEPVTGYYRPSLHPLGYHMMMVWNFLVQGSSKNDVLIKTISPIYTLYTLLLLYHVLAVKGRVFGYLCMFTYITAPAIVRVTSICHIDPIRMYTFCLAFVWLCETIGNNKLRNIFMTGLTSGFSMYSHAIGGILTLPFIMLVYFFTSKKPVFQKITSFIIIATVALVIGGHRYVMNYNIYGSIFSAKTEVLEMEKIAYSEHVRVSRGIDSMPDRIVNGFLMGFSKFDWFGLSYWLFILPVVFFYKGIWKDKCTRVFYSVVFLFYAVVFLSLLLDIDLIKNVRYFLTIQPFIAYGGALFLGNLYEKMANN